MGLKSTQGDEERLGLATTLYGTRCPLLCHPERSRGDLRFGGPFVEMFFDRASWIPAVSANNTQSASACERTKRLDRQVQ